MLDDVFQCLNEASIVARVLMYVGFFRLVFKPIMTALNIFVRMTPTDADNRLLDNLQKSVPYAVFIYGLDWFGSIKVKENRRWE